MDKCLYSLTDKKLPESRAAYKSNCGFIYVRVSGLDNKPTEGELCMKCKKPITLIQMDNLKSLAKQLPNHLVIEKALWVGNIKIDINHIDNDLNKPLDYVDAFERMIKKLKKETP